MYIKHIYIYIYKIFHILGDIVAPSLEGLGHLIRRPCGCGEQTMMYLAPNVYVIQYLKTTQQLSTDIRRKVITNINIGTVYSYNVIISVINV